MMDITLNNPAYVQASIKTASDLRTAARAVQVSQLTSLTLPEVDQVVDMIANMVPAGNVPGVILNGLVRLDARRAPRDVVRRDVDRLFKGVEQVLDKAVYGAVFAGPAAVIWAYQGLLKLAGKEPEDSFPEGIWQFYVDYALREDTARHNNETHGFDSALNQHGIQLSEVDRATAWVMAVIHVLHHYDALLENEWRERVHLRLLAEIAANHPRQESYSRLPAEWARQRPYGRGADADRDSYSTYRRKLFNRFVEESTRDLPRPQMSEWQARIAELEAQALPAYQRQMSILAYLEPGAYSEMRIPVPLEKVQVGLISRGRYFLIPGCRPGSTRSAQVNVVRDQIAAILATRPRTTSGALQPLAGMRRHEMKDLRPYLEPATLGALDALRCAPVLLNLDRRPASLPLAELRQTERGVGDHALSIFDTGKTFVFDQSHIFFDGAWGAALAEILTNEALSWAVYLKDLPRPQPDAQATQPLVFFFNDKDRTQIERAFTVTPEASAESEAVNLKAILRLRKLLRQRSESIQLTVNDLLVLYRAIHAVTYQPHPSLISELERFLHDPEKQHASIAAMASLRSQENPTILIPIDASQSDPIQRLYPLSFDVPLADLNLLQLHHQALVALAACLRAAPDEHDACYKTFDAQRREYLAALAGFGAVLGRAKQIANAGESSSVGVIKMLAHLPAPLQRMLDQVPERFDILNDLIKGREVFSNVGAVASSSTLTRFTTAKDDNEKKTLAWGVLTDAQGVMKITLRDFRPHVALLATCGKRDLALRITRHYLDSYVVGLNNYINELNRITMGSRVSKS